MNAAVGLCSSNSAALSTSGQMQPGPGVQTEFNGCSRNDRTSSSVHYITITATRTVSLIGTVLRIVSSVTIKYLLVSTSLLLPSTGTQQCVEE
ncbi:hypothetical protein J6590_006446 [Homalodisca vitripennis]|nr:hypothetical protein J6590_006446 [Homalodisca vitripennis]